MKSHSQADFLLRPVKKGRTGSQRTQLFENKIWSVEDVAAYTGYSIGTLYNLTSRDLIPHRKKRGKLYFIPLEIQNWIDEGD